MNPINPNNQLEYVRKTVKAVRLELILPEPPPRKETVAVWPDLKFNKDWKPVPRRKKSYRRENTVVTIQDVSDGKL